MKKNLILMSALFASSMIVNSGFGANLERNSIKREHNTELETQNNQAKKPCVYDDRTFKFNTPEELNEFITHDKLSALNVNDLIELAGDVKRLSSPRYANHDLFSPEMVSDVLNRILMISDALNRILIEIRNKKGNLYLDQNRNFDTFLYAYQDNRDAWDLITSDRMDDKEYAFSSFDNTIKYFQCYSQLDNTIKSDLIKHLIRERDKATIDYCANMEFRYFKEYYDCNPSAIKKNPIQAIEKLMQLSDSIVKGGSNVMYSCAEISSILDKIFTIFADRDFKFDDYKHLSNFIRTYHKYTNAMDFITPYRLSNIATFDLFETAKNIKRKYHLFSNLQEQEKEPILNKILNTLTDRNFKFTHQNILYTFILAYCDNTKAMDLITPDRLSNINTEDLLQIAAEIKREWFCFSNLQEQEKEPILNKILNILTDRNFKFTHQNILYTFILAYCDNTKAMDLITPDRLSNINTEDLFETAKNIKKYHHFSNLQDHTEELMLNKIFTALTDRDFKFKDDWHLKNFIRAYYNNTKAMDLITPDRLSNIKTHYLIETSTDIREAYYPFSNLQDPEKELILNKILATLTNRDFKFDDSNSLKNFIRAYHKYTKAMNLITPDRLSNIETHYLIETSTNIREAHYPFSNLQEQEKETILNKILNILTDRDFKFDDHYSLKNFIRAYRDNTKAMDLITSDRLSDVPTEQLESSVKWLNDFLPRANPSEKANIQRVIDIIDQKLL